MTFGHHKWLWVVGQEPETRPPCTVCSTPAEKHGSFPTCATHPYTPDANCRHVLGAACVGPECKNGCVRAAAPAREERSHG